MKKASILRKLEGGDRRSIGRSNDVVKDVLANPSKFGVLMAGFSADDPVARARVADAAEKISAVHPEWLRPHKARLLRELARNDQMEVRWHLAQMVPRVRWSVRERQQVLASLEGYLRDASSIVKTFAMQALADLAQQTPELRPTVILQIEALTVCGTPAMSARGRKLLAVLRPPTRHGRS